MLLTEPAKEETTMKKTLAAILSTAVLLLSFTACGGADASAATDSAAEPQTQTEASPSEETREPNGAPPAGEREQIPALPGEDAGEHVHIIP